MIKLQLHNGQKRQLKNLFSDITMSELKTAYGFLNNTHVEILKYLKGENDEINQSKLLDFKIDWICLFSNIKKDELTKLAVVSEIDLSIDYLFSEVLKFCYFPSEVMDVKEFELNGVTYKLIKEITTISGAKMLFGNGTYNQFKLAQMLARQVKEELTPNVADSLLQLVAVLYSSDGDNSDEAINKRVTEFHQISAMTAYSCLFFFTLLVKRYNAFLRLYSSEMETMEKKAMQVVLRQEAEKISLEKGIFGKLLPFKLQKSKYLIMDKSLDWML